MFSQIHQEKRERTQINKVRNERREIITNVTEIKKHERILCITIKHKAINWTTQKKWINFQRHTIFQTESGTNRQSEIDKFKKNSQQIKIQDQTASQGNSTNIEYIQREELILSFSKYSKKIEEGTLPNSLHKTTINLILKIGKNSTKKIISQYLR